MFGYIIGIIDNAPSLVTEFWSALSKDSERGFVNPNLNFCKRDDRRREEGREVREESESWAALSISGKAERDGRGLESSTRWVDCTIAIDWVGASDIVFRLNVVEPPCASAKYTRLAGWISTARVARIGVRSSGAGAWVLRREGKSRGMGVVCMLWRGDLIRRLGFLISACGSGSARAEGSSHVNQTANRLCSTLSGCVSSNRLD